jgi:hypothetical protein
MNYSYAIAFIILGIFLILFTSIALSDSQTPATYYQNYTRAIYDGMTLRDYIFVCSNNRVVSVLPTGNFITVGSNWTDPRDRI